MVMTSRKRWRWRGEEGAAERSDESGRDEGLKYQKNQYHVHDSLI
jgi:hypothetical protein